MQKSLPFLTVSRPATRRRLPFHCSGPYGHGLWFARRGEHSQKPPIAHEWFERLWPHSSRVELFARERSSF